MSYGKMTMRRTIWILLLLLSLGFSAGAEGYDSWERRNPYACLDEAQETSFKEIPEKLAKKLAGPEPTDAHELCVMAELLKRVGDYCAEDYYKKSIEAQPAEPAYELFFADYLRNFRGPQRPLFPEAEAHYLRALAKLKSLEDTRYWRSYDNVTKSRVKRGLINLYQQDGVPLLYSTPMGLEPKRPALFLGTVNRYAKSTSEFDEVDDVRDFTSEALFASSPQRLNRPLTEDELRNIIREKEQFETSNRFRLRYKSLPVVDVFYKYRDVDDAQITQFFAPNEFNDVDLNEYGVAIEKPIAMSPYFDLFLRGTYKHTIRQGVIEFLADEDEDIGHFEANAAVSRFFGPDKATLDFTYVYQDIDPDIADPPERDRHIFASTLTYNLMRPVLDIKDPYVKRFETRGLELFGGVVYDKERFGNVDVKKNNFFVGASLKGFKLANNLNPFDFTVQPTVFTSEVEGDSSQDNSQYRTNLTLLYRFIDEEQESKKLMGMDLAFLHLTIPFKHDVAIDGLDDFENFRIGFELTGKFFVKKFRGTTCLASLYYDFERFYELDKNLNLFGLKFGIGF